jgi:uncharacterized protein YbjT (DUF2867 family)
MSVTVFGSTGGTGRLTIRRLLQSADKHTVVAVARTPAALDDIVNADDVDCGRLIVMKGDLMDPASVAAAVQGADVVVYAAGAASISQAARQKTVIYSQGGWTSSLVQFVSSTVIAGTQRGLFCCLKVHQTFLLEAVS